MYKQKVSESETSTTKSDIVELLKLYYECPVPDNGEGIVIHHPKLNYVG